MARKSVTCTSHLLIKRNNFESTNPLKQKFLFHLKSKITPWPLCATSVLRTLFFCEAKQKLSLDTTSALPSQRFLE